jgi:hypothetical protein
MGFVVNLRSPDGSERDITISKALRWNVTGMPSGLDVSTSLSIAEDQICFRAFSDSGASSVSFSGTIELQWGGVRGALPMDFTFWGGGA